MIERFNRIIKDNIVKYFTANSTRKYIDVLDTLVDQYNNTVHSLTKMSCGSKKNKNNVFRNLYTDFGANPNAKIFSW